MKWYLSTKFEGKIFYHDGNGGWAAAKHFRHLFSSIDHARQTKAASVFCDSIIIHGEPDAQEEQQENGTQSV